ncbi:lipase family protein [Nocardia australiensis]|uniref:lipase family protein n=1 Tax=Nocardia australiensis TaxID=2887191 RepID=UPI001D15294C|nr:lipase family protein [Nocardia australiensis]
MPHNEWLAGAGSAQRLTYWTRTSEGKPALSTGSVFVPSGPVPAGGWPVVSWEHATTGLGDSCAPSVAGSDSGSKTYQSHWLGQGYAVVATDYIGLGTDGVHPYLDGRAEAHAGIDMVRAARSVAPTLSPRWVAIGQSQGGQAALFTASLATSYAPDLDYRGAVATAPATNISDMLSLLTPQTPDIGIPHVVMYASFVLRGLAASRPGLDIDSYLTPLGKQLVHDAETLCAYPMVGRAKGITVGQMLSRPLAEGDLLEVAAPIVDVPITGYDRPLFIGNGTADTDVPPPLTTRLIADFTLRGVKFDYRSYPGVDHLDTATAALPDSTPFVQRLFD